MRGLTAAQLKRAAKIFKPNLKESLTPEEIEQVYQHVLTLLDISMNYECFGENATTAENAFGCLLTVLTADKARGQSRVKSRRQLRTAKRVNVICKECREGRCKVHHLPLIGQD